jgi:glycosyltransferase involved in cell wall biosynthesis
LKYWLLTTEFPPFFGGGIGTYSAITSTMMANEGHDVSVFVNDSSVNDIKIDRKTDGVRIIRFNPFRTKSSNFLGHVTNISYEFAHILKHFIEKEGKPDMIESQEYLGIAYYLLQYKYLLYDWCKEIPVIITMHSPSFLYMEYNHVPEYKYPNYWICEMERFCLQAADLLISPSQFMIDELKKRFELRNQNVQVIVNPFLNKWKHAEIKLGFHKGEIVFYGKLTVQKGALHLLKYFKELWESGFPRPLHLIGGQDIVYHAEKKTMGDFVRKSYKKYINQGLLKLEKKIKPEEISTRLANAEVVIVPSANDNLPYVVLEMMAMGKIILASKQGGQSESIENGSNGFIFDHQNPHTFFDQLNKILKLDKSERETIAKKAMKTIDIDYSSEKIYTKKIDSINKLVASKIVKKEFPLIRNYRTSIKAHPELPFKKGKLSIVITFYNSGIYLDEIIQCIKSSVYPDKELIIMNDGSQDPFSLEKLEYYRQQDGIKVIDKVNKGLPDTRNCGAEIAEGEFLAFIDADDKIHHDYYSIAIGILKHYENIHFVGCWTKYFEGSKNIWPTFNPEPPLILYHNLVNSAALIYRRNSFFAAGKNDLKMTFQGFEDYDTIISFLENGYNGVIIPETLFYYRVRPTSMVRGITTIKRLAIAQYISNKHKNFYGKFAPEIFNLLNANGPGIFLDNPSLDYDLSDKIRLGGKLTGKIISLVKKNRVAKTIAYKIYRLLNK